MNIPRCWIAACAAALLGWSGPSLAADGYGPRVLRTVPPKLILGPVDYYGGPVVGDMQIVSILWGAQVSKTTAKEVPEYLTALANSTYVDQLSIYDTFHKGVTGHKGTKQHIHRGTYVGQIQIAPQNTSLQVSDRDIIKELQYQIELGVLPPQTLNMWYLIYFPQNVSIYLPGYGYSCSDWLAYHWSSKRKRPSKSNIYYGVEPECGNFATITWTTSHEFAETLTDPVATGGTPDYPQAWLTPGNAEIGDLCMGNYGMLSDGTNSYLVQQEYLNSTRACSTGDYTSP